MTIMKMDNDRPDNMRRYGCISVILLYLVSLLAGAWLFAALSGCTRTVYEPVETVRTQLRDREVQRLATDTVRDTRLVWVKGDTVMEIREREHLRLVAVHDTCFIEHVDSIRVPYPVEHELTRWQQTKMDLGGFALGGIAVALCTAVVWLIKKFRK